MSATTASIRDLRLNFRSLKRKIEQHGSIIITDNGIPSYKLEVVRPRKEARKPLPDYEARLRRQMSKRLSAKETEDLHRENRGDR